MGGQSVEQFIKRWQGSGGSELSNSQSFLKELCTLLGVDEPSPMTAGDEAPAYAFERQVSIANPDGSFSHGRIDLYKRGCFVLESKQGTLREESQAPLFKELTKPPRRKGAAVRHTRGWDEAMLRAKGQAERYVRHLPASEGRPPFIVVVDIGHSIELYSEFSMTGGAYIHFPDPRSYRILLDDLHQPELRERLRLVWTDPLTLDPSRRSAKVTREIAAHLAELAKSLEAAGHRPKDVADFLMRCLFTMFAEDVGLIPAKGFARLLNDVTADPAKFKPMVQDLWKQMKTGGFSSYLMENIPHFNGYLFADAGALALDADQVRLLGLAAKADWRDVEPAIFGTLLERALDPDERHKLGAHYTPRAYVERLVMPTIVEPLRAEWDGVKAAVVSLARQDQEAKALEELRAFHRRLCQVRILDPACGTGNFLYVSLEHLKRLEGEVLDLMERFGHRQAGFEVESGLTVDPHQFLGIEINPRAAAIAELVLWIGYLQWHFRTHGQTNPPEPIIRDFKNIENRDAVLAWDSTKPEIDPQTLKPKTRWDGRTYKKSPVTGEDIPDESARVLVEKYINPRQAKWPKADFVVGNPPFIGNKLMRRTLGDGYVVALREAWEEVPNSVDYVMYWWNKAASLCKGKRVSRFGLISTNSITQNFNRRVVGKFVASGPGASLAFAIPDHPWVDSKDGAAVRIAMTVGIQGLAEGTLINITKEEKAGDDGYKILYSEKRGKINQDLSIGVNIDDAKPLLSNSNLCGQGIKLVGDGFVVGESHYASIINPNTGHPITRGLVSPAVVLDNMKPKTVIDFFGCTEDEAKRIAPDAYQHLLVNVKPFRDENERKSIRELWWRFAWERPNTRSAINGLTQYIVTLETAKYVIFVSVPSFFLWDGSLFAFALEDYFALGILSCKIHEVWVRLAGGLLGPTPRYNRSKCFENYPFPCPPEALKARIRELGERLDAHRKRQQELHPDLTMTGMYNVLEMLKAGQPLTDQERAIHEKGLVSVLKQIHDELDAAVFEAYGWPPTLSDEEILERLVALNKERAAEEAKGIIHWLRPEYQAPETMPHTQADLLPAEPKAATPAELKKQPWPSNLAEQAQAVRQALESLGGPADVASVARCFTRAPRAKVAELLETLAGLGQARALGGGRYGIN